MPPHNNAEPNAHRPARISVLRDQHLVPLLPSSGTALPAVQPWNGVLLERHRVRPVEIPQHEHPDLCIHLQLSGAAPFEWWSGGSNALESTRPGSLILIPPGTSDRLRWTGPSVRLILSVSPDRLAALAAELGSPRPPEFRHAWSLRDPTLQHLIVEMGRQAGAGWPLGSLYAGLLATGLETQLLQAHAADPLAKPLVRGGLSLPRLKQAMEYINANLAEDIHLDAIARELDLSASHFAHQFRNSTGRTPYQYLLDQRIARATHLLRDTNSPVQFIAAVTGFTSPVNFVRAFRQRVGVTPQAWRQNR